MIRHTPGPWHKGRGGEILADSSKGFEQWESFYPELHSDYGGYPIAESVMGCNVPLIVAAPDLLKACKIALDALGCDRVRTDRLVAQEVIHKAVEKAEGQ